MLRRTTLGNSALPQPSSRQSGVGTASSSFGGGGGGRPSLGPAMRKSLAADMHGLSLQQQQQQQSQENRMSNANKQRQSLTRRSSAFGRQSSMGTQQAMGNKDPRNIRDKQWQLAAIRNLVKFVLEAGYDRPISPKILTTPSVKDFQHIFMFLYNRLDSGYTWPNKFEEDILVLVKCMRYPYAETITKSTLQAVGSIHAWPCLLALLIWMVELLMVCEGIDSELGGGVDGGHAADPDRLFTDFLVRSYDQYMLGQTDFETLEEEMQDNFRDNQNLTMKDIESLQVENASLQEQLAAYNAEPSPLEKLDFRRGEIADDTQKVKKWIDTLTVKRSQLSEQVETLKNELDIAMSEMEKVNNEKDQLQDIVDAQEISPADIDRMNAERDQLSKNLEVFTQRSEELNQTNWNLEIECQRKIDNVEKLTQTYNGKCYKLNVVPSTSPNAVGINFECTLNTNAAKPDQIVSIDLRGTIKDRLIHLRSKFKKNALDVEDEAAALSDECDRIADSIVVKLDELSVIEERISAIHDRYESAKEQSNAELDAMTSEIDTLDREIRRVRVERSRGVFDHQKELREYEIEYDNVLRRHAEAKERLLKQGNRALDDVRNFKRQIYRPLEELKMAITRDHQSLMAEHGKLIEKSGASPAIVKLQSEIVNIADVSFSGDVLDNFE